MAGTKPTHPPQPRRRNHLFGLETVGIVGPAGYVTRHLDAAGSLARQAVGRAGLEARASTSARVQKIGSGLYFAFAPIPSIWSEYLEKLQAPFLEV